MTRRGATLASQHGATLPHFPSLRAARAALLGLRDDALDHLRRLAAADAAAGFTPDGTPSSLLALERWYFALHEAKAFRRRGTTRARFEQAMGFYVGDVAVRTGPDVAWIVAPFAFAEGRYEIGVRTQGTGAEVLGLDGLCADWWKTPSNVRRRALHRWYAERWPAPRTAAVRARPVAGAGDDVIEAAIRATLARASTPRVHPGTLVTFVVHRLRKDARARPPDVRRVIEALTAAGVLVRVPAARGADFRLRLR